jgi:pilus assembly protein CpaD
MLVILLSKGGTMKNHSKFYVRAASLAVLLLATSLAGCAADDALMGDNSFKPYNGSDKYPITVAKGPVTLEVASNHGTLQPGQVNAVQGFLHQATSASVTPITLARPSGGGGSTRVASEIASLMAGQGIPRQRIVFATYDAPGNAPVRLSYVSTYAATKPCGNWETDLADSSSNEGGSNHGCAVQANIAAMVANPETLVVPNATTPIPAAGRVAAITALTTGSTGSAPKTSSSSSAAPASP